MMLELFGLFATGVLVISMFIKTEKIKWTILMRTLNGISSILFIIYSMLLPTKAYSTALANFIITIVDIYYVFIYIKKYRKQEEQIK